MEVFVLCSYSHISLNHPSCSNMLVELKVALSFERDSDVARLCVVYTSDSLRSMANR